MKIYFHQVVLEVEYYAFVSRLPQNVIRNSLACAEESRIDTMTLSNNASLNFSPSFSVIEQ